jgi:hypothetical protein
MPTSIEVWILKWIVAPFIAILLISGLVRNSSSIDECDSVCSNKGYADFRHRASGKRACYCLTEEESKVKNKFINGTKVDFN